MSTTAPLQNTVAKPKQSSNLGKAGLPLQRKCACGSPTSSLTGECEECKRSKQIGVQPKLKVNEPNDRYEQEADRIAEEVVRSDAVDRASRLSSIHAVARPISRLQRQEMEDVEAEPDERLEATEVLEEDEEAIKADDSGMPKREEGVAEPVMRPDESLNIPQDNGHPLEASVHQAMERRMGYDFSHVRIHTDAGAIRSARQIKAHAYTLGSDIYFNEGRYNPHDLAGLKLLTHELTHVVQQGGGAAGTGGIVQRKKAGAAAKKKKPAPENKKPRAPDDCPSPDPLWKKGTVCKESAINAGKGRKSRENIDFPRTYIERIKVDLGAARMSLAWNNPCNLPFPNESYEVSVGAGRCCVECSEEEISKAGRCSVDCNDKKISQQPGTLCTPKDGVFPVNYTTYTPCILGSHTKAHNPTYFSRSGIAIHSGHLPREKKGLPPYPNSHGCVRTTEKASEIVHDNSRWRTQPTQIEVKGTWKSPYCYLSENSDKQFPNTEEGCADAKQAAKPVRKRGTPTLRTPGLRRRTTDTSGT